MFNKTKEDLEKIIGQHTEDVPQGLSAEVVHADDLVVLPS